MAWLTRLLCLLGQHDVTYRERRDWIQHYVCACCGQATPVISRTADEHERVLALGRVAHPRASVLQKPSASERARAKQVLGI